MQSLMDMKNGVRVVLTLMGIFLMAGLLSPSSTLAAEVAGVVAGNKLLAVEIDKSNAKPTIHIKAEKPVGYRYTVYDSFDPVRVVIDFPGMDPDQLPESIKVAQSPVEEVRISSYDLSSGRLSRVEMLLSVAAEYNVSLEGNEIVVAFDPMKVAQSKKVSELVTKKEIKTESPTLVSTGASVAAQSRATEAGTGKIVSSVEIKENLAVLTTDGPAEKYRFFNLGDPPRLVVDIYEAKPGFSKRTFDIPTGFKRLRVGDYKDKTRFVFDSDGGQLPGYSVKQKDEAILVAWGAGPDVIESTENVPGATKTKSSPLPSSMGTVDIDAVDFTVVGTQSILRVKVSGISEVIEPELKGNTVGFGLKNADISRALKRSIDPSSFPSAVRLITPYTVLVGHSQDVRFAVELKGKVPYSFQQDGNELKLIVENGSFAQSAPPSPEKVSVPVDTKPSASSVSAPSVSTSKPTAEPIPVVIEKPSLPEGGSQKVYSGQKISLVFDNADILNILQLIAEVSDMNIIADDTIKGNITLRLIDVPWDQALDLIMDIKGLGMIQEGSVVRIVPEKKLRELEKERMEASREKEQLEDLETEVITVSHTSINNLSKPATELLTKRGKITEDSRNKQLIVTDVPTVISSIKNLVSILDTPERQVLIEARIVEANSDFSRDFGVKWGFFDDKHTTFDNKTTVRGGLGGSFLISPPSSGSVLSGSGFATGITFGKIGSATLDLRISALEAAGQGKVISTPRVSTLNGQEAKISQGTKIPYQSVGSNGETKTEFVNANLELKVKPEINPDDSVILEIMATNSSIGSTVSTGAGSAPSINTKEAQTKLLVRNGETTVIGGIFVETDTESDAGVPVVKNLPFIGNLFKSTKKEKTRRELLIFVTPKIVN